MKLRDTPTFNELLKDVREKDDMLHNRNDVESTPMSKTITSISKPTPETKVNPGMEQQKTLRQSTSASSN